jgi:hypothetical protein
MELCELVLYRIGDGVTIYLEISVEDLNDDDRLSAILAEQKRHGFDWIPDFR